VTDTGEVIEFYDPRYKIKKQSEEIFGNQITNHSLSIQVQEKIISDT
jgi:hypothetical protein